ncbi:hypothetical protein LR48_Vigan03g114700 [Vigna angularis]|uniref:Uncharacterized protein n=1 Tax=Phaseolus angularis TaxID=3914 RepID=A0A0L9U4P9_PHAAN|nr:hypothetical protein LR48_Vigan03g114700 [Vigna angularis]
MEMQSELSNRLQIWTLAKMRAETQLERAIWERTKMVREIEELRRQREVLNQRIEFCKQKDAIGMAARLADTRCTFREYTTEEIQAAKVEVPRRLEQCLEGTLQPLHCFH